MIKYRVLSTGDIGTTSELYPDTSFPESGPSPEWLISNGAEIIENLSVLKTEEDIAKDIQNGILSQLKDLDLIVPRGLEDFISSQGDATKLPKYTQDIIKRKENLRSQLM